jgi:hypothetical protein
MRDYNRNIEDESKKEEIYADSDSTEVLFKNS